MSGPNINLFTTDNGILIIELEDSIISPTGFPSIGCTPLQAKEVAKKLAQLAEEVEKETMAAITKVGLTPRVCAACSKIYATDPITDAKTLENFKIANPHVGEESIQTICDDCGIVMKNRMEMMKIRMRSTLN